MGKDKEKRLVDARCGNRHVASMNSLRTSHCYLSYTSLGNVLIMQV